MFSHEEKRVLWGIVSKRARPLLAALENLERDKLVDDVVHELMDAVGSELADKGFDERDVINDYGRSLESLLGKMVRELKPGPRRHA